MIKVGDFLRSGGRSPCADREIADLDSVDLDAEEWSGDINNVASVLKLWLRELPDPLMTYELHSGFLEAASEFFFLRQIHST